MASRGMVAIAGRRPRQERAARVRHEGHSRLGPGGLPMTCRHAKGDPDCSSTRNYDDLRPSTASNRRIAEAMGLPATPDKTVYEIEQTERIGDHLVLRVRYPNCQKCAYEGNKIMVFLNVPETQALKW